MERSVLLSHIADTRNMRLIGDDIEIQGFYLCKRKTEYTSVISYATSEKYAAMAVNNRAVKALIITQDLYDIIKSRNGISFSVLISDNPEEDFYNLHHYLYNKTDFYDKFNFPKGIGNNSKIHPSAVIEDGVIIGDNFFIDAFSIVKRGSIIGDDVKIGCNTIISGEGFQIININSVPTPIIHAGGCIISNGVTIFNNVVISKSLFEGATYIGENVNINSLVSIDHNCKVEKNVLITAGVNLCGSAYVKTGAWLGANATVLNNVTIGENALLGIGCVAIRDIPDNAVAVGNPARIIKYKEL